MNWMFVAAAAVKAVFCQLQCLHDHRFLCRVGFEWVWALCSLSLSLWYTMRIPRAYSITHISDTAGSRHSSCEDGEDEAGVFELFRLLLLIFCMQIITITLELRWLDSEETTQKMISLWSKYLHCKQSWWWWCRAPFLSVFSPAVSSAVSRRLCGVINEYFAMLMQATEVPLVYNHGNYSTCIHASDSGVIKLW